MRSAGKVSLGMALLCFIAISCSKPPALKDIESIRHIVGLGNQRIIATPLKNASDGTPVIVVRSEQHRNLFLPLESGDEFRISTPHIEQELSDYENRACRVADCRRQKPTIEPNINQQMFSSECKEFFDLGFVPITAIENANEFLAELTQELNDGILRCDIHGRCTHFAKAISSQKTNSIILQCSTVLYNKHSLGAPEECHPVAGRINNKFFVAAIISTRCPMNNQEGPQINLYTQEDKWLTNVLNLIKESLELLPLQLDTQIQSRNAQHFTDRVNVCHHSIIEGVRFMKPSMVLAGGYREMATVRLEVHAEIDPNRFYKVIEKALRERKEKERAVEVGLDRFQVISIDANIKLYISKGNSPDPLDWHPPRNDQENEYRSTVLRIIQDRLRKYCKPIKNNEVINAGMILCYRP